MFSLLPPRGRTRKLGALSVVTAATGLGTVSFGIRIEFAVAAVVDSPAVIISESAHITSKAIAGVDGDVQAIAVLNEDEAAVNVVVNAANVDIIAISEGDRSA